MSVPRRPMPVDTPETRRGGNGVNLVGRVPAGTGPLTRAWRTIRQGAGTTGAHRDLADLAADLQVPLPTGRRVVVTSERGGAGKTAITALLATAYCARRIDPVLAATAEAGIDSLGWRLGARSEATLEQLQPALARAATVDLAGMAELVPRTPWGLWTLPAMSTPAPAVVRDVTRAMSRLFTICVIDAGGIDSATTDAVLSEAHAVVVVIPATADGVRAAMVRLGRIAAGAHGALARVVVALNHLSPVGSRTLRLAVAIRELESLGVPVTQMPYDRHLAAGAPITPSRLCESTVVASTVLAGVVLRRAHPL